MLINMIKRNIFPSISYSVLSLENEPGMFWPQIICKAQQCYNFIICHSNVETKLPIFQPQRLVYIIL